MPSKLWCSPPKPSTLINVLQLLQMMTSLSNLDPFQKQIIPLVDPLKLFLDNQDPLQILSYLGI